MATAFLPERPHLDQLRRLARELQRAVRAGDPGALMEAGAPGPVLDFPLSTAQLLIARRYGFASWPRLAHHVEAIRRRTWEYRTPDDAASPAHRFLSAACLNYHRDEPAQPKTAMAILADNPALVDTQIAVAAVVGDVTAVRKSVQEYRSAASDPTGPFDWAPLMYLTYSRLLVDPRGVLDAARLLLDVGANPNDGRFFDGLATPFTVLTGAFGGGEGGQAPHEASSDLARLLLDAGADPNDAQALYNRMFTPTDDFLDILFDFGLGSGDGGPWRRALPDVLDPPSQLVRGLLEWAVVHDQRDRVALLARRGVDVIAPLASGRTPIETATDNGHAQLAAQLMAFGAPAPRLDPVAQFISAALARDATAVHDTPADVVAGARRARPALPVWAAAHGRVEAVELLVRNGFDIDALGRGDVPVEQPWQTALHTAVERDDAVMVERLLELGADTTIRDARFDATPAQWATHLGHDGLATLFDS